MSRTALLAALTVTVAGSLPAAAQNLVIFPNVAAQGLGPERLGGFGRRTVVREDHEVLGRGRQAAGEMDSIQCLALHFWPRSP
jgi:hypothetical protein